MVSRRNRQTSLPNELGCAKKIVVTRRIYLDAMHPVGVYQHVVEIPQIDVRQVFCQDLLDLVIQRLALLLVQGTLGLTDQLVHSRVRVKSPVGTLGGEAAGSEDVFENVWIQVAASHPA